MNPVEFLKESYQELRKASWLARQQAIGSTVIIIILISMVAVYASFIDLVLSNVLRALLGS